MVEDHVKCFEVPRNRVAAVPIDDIVLEAEALMVLRPGPLNLPIAPEGDDVIAENVLLAVVLVQPAMRRTVDQIFLGEDAGLPSSK